MLNRAQDYQLRSFLSSFGYFDAEFLALPVATKIVALQAILDDDVYAAHRARLEATNVLDNVDAIRLILAHPCPQNRAVGVIEGGQIPAGHVVWKDRTTGEFRTEQAGLLGLSKENIVGEEPVTRDDVLRYIHLYVRRQMHFCLVEQDRAMQRRFSALRQDTAELHVTQDDLAAFAQRNLNRSLYAAIGDLDVERVVRLLRLGADVNAILSDSDEDITPVEYLLLSAQEDCDLSGRVLPARAAAAAADGEAESSESEDDTDDEEDEDDEEYVPSPKRRRIPLERRRSERLVVQEKRERPVLSEHLEPAVLEDRHVRRLRILKMLFEGGVDVNRFDLYAEMSPLLCAAAVVKDPRYVSYLLEIDDVIVDVRDREGNTPLHKSVECNCAKVAKVLLLHRAGVEIKNHERKAPWQMNPGAAQKVVLGRKLLSFVRANRNDAFVLELLEAGADVNFRDERGASALTVFLGRRQWDNVELALGYGARFMGQDLYTVINVGGDFQDILNKLRSFQERGCQFGDSLLVEGIGKCLKEGKDAEWFDDMVRIFSELNVFFSDKVLEDLDRLPGVEIDFIPSDVYSSTQEDIMQSSEAAQAYYAGLDDEEEEYEDGYGISRFGL